MKKAGANVDPRRTTRANPAVRGLLLEFEPNTQLTHALLAALEVAGVGRSAGRTWLDAMLAT